MIQKGSRTNRFKLVLFILLFLMIWLIWDNTRIQTTHLIIKDAALPENFDGYRIAHLSDLHSRNWRGKLTHLIDEEEPEMIVITGDLIDAKTTDLQPVMNFIEDIAKIAPVYYVSGNHEASTYKYKELEHFMINTNIEVLNNEVAVVKLGQEEITILGLQDPSFKVKSYLSRDEEIFIDATLSTLTQNLESYTLLLSHRPELFDIYAKYEVDMAFTGHAHGGQVRIPFVGGLIAPNQGFLPEYTSGVYQKNNTHMIVSRGLGNSVIPVRVNNPAELIIVELTQ